MGPAWGRSVIGAWAPPYDNMTVHVKYSVAVFLPLSVIAAILACMAKQRPAESEPEDASLPVAARALSPRERRRVRTMREIQGRALALFTEQGYGQTTIEQIAEASDISARTFFRYFPTKEDVVFWDEYDAVVLETLDSWPADLPLGETLRIITREALGALYRHDPERLLARHR